MPIDLQVIAQEMGIGKLKHHIFLCCGPHCCSSEAGEEVWQYLKQRLKELNLTGPNGPIHRTRVDCLRICQQGPVALVYPEGIWYHQVDKGKMERIIQHHLIQGKPLSNESFAQNSLSV